ncbi:MAG: anti-sigma factor family protein [Candidatus Poribacteria bacterium]
MKCKKVKKMLSDYIDGNIGKTESLSINQHILECDSCRQELESFKKLFELIDNVSKVDYPPESTWKNFISDLHTRIEKEALSEYVEGQKNQTYMKWGWASIAIASVVFFIFSLSLEFRPSPLIEQDQPQNKTISISSQTLEKSEKLSIAEAISRTFIDEKEAKELKKLEKIADYDVFAPSSYNPYILSDLNTISNVVNNDSIKSLLDENLSGFDSFDSAEYYVSVTGKM